MRHLHGSGLAALALLALTLTTGCYVEEEPAASAQAPPPPAEELQETPATELSNTGARSGLGAAKRSAKNTVGAVEQRQSELEKQLEDDND